MKYEQFMEPITQSVGALIYEVEAATFSGLKGKGVPYKPKKRFKTKTKK